MVLRIFTTLAAAALLCLPAGCERRDSLDRILSRGELVVVSRNSPTTYYVDKSGPTGFEYALAGLLARNLGVELKMQTAFSLDAIFERLERGEADLAAAGLSLTGQRRATFPHALPYDSLKPLVVYVAGTFRPRAPRDLAGMTVVALEGSSHIEALQALRQEGYPDLAWEAVPGADTMALLERVDSGDATVGVIDSSEFAVQQSLFPRLKVAFELGAEQDMVWYLAPGSDNTRLQSRIADFLTRLQETGTLERLREEHFGHSDGASRISAHTFTRNMRRTLPDYSALIQRVAGEHGLDWHLLAAMAYQESHWDPRAESPTGVRGMMMLTLPTAQELGVEDRLDPLQSLRGGARYLKNIHRRLPRDIYEPDRTWLALAAYNIGMGHLEDARVITDRQGGDPHLWRDVMERLPLLEDPAFYRTVRYGYARGGEAVTYVQNIRHYHSILQWQEIPERKPLPPLKTARFIPEVIRASRLSAL